MVNLPTRKNIWNRKANSKFLNIVNTMGVSKSTMVFQIPITNFLNKHPKMKKSSLSLHFLNNNFKITK